MVVPAGHADEGRIGSRGDRLENGDVGLGRGVSGRERSIKTSKCMCRECSRIRRLGEKVSAYWSSGV